MERTVCCHGGREASRKANRIFLTVDDMMMKQTVLVGDSNPQFGRRRAGFSRSSVFLRDAQEFLGSCWSQRICLAGDS